MCNEHSNQNRKGASLNDKEAHHKDHKNWSRRNFIQTLGLASGSGLAMGGFTLSPLASSAAMSLLNTGGVQDRILVLIRLAGGNDGLNTIIPIYDYGTYSNNRPTIGIPMNEITELTDKFGVPSSMSDIVPMWNDGKMKVINTVGYENHNLSHFTSSDIMGASNVNINADEDKSGWLGRYILDQNPDYIANLPDVPAAIKISSGSSNEFYNPDEIDLAVNFNTPERLLAIAESGLLYDTENLPDDCYYGEQIEYLRSLLNLTFNFAPAISNAYSEATNSVDYGQTELARQLSIVARLIKGGLGTKLYMVTLNGFDTHEGQNQSHPRLMQELTGAINNFYLDLASDNLDNDVLSMTFSEFGRRIKENSGGTDHGTAAPVMLFGPALNGNGILGEDPDMNDVDNNGNLKHSVDFRSIYASLLESWLCLDPAGVDTVLGEVYDRIDGLGFDCNSVGIADLPKQQGVRHLARPDGYGGTVIEYTLDRPGNIDLTIYSILGQKIITLKKGYQSAGKHQATYVNRYSGITAAPLVYQLHTEHQQYSGKFIVSN